MAKLARATRGLRRQAEANPLDHIAWLPGQIAWLSDRGPLPKLYRAGVRSGKTTAACAEVIWRCLGEHPFNPDVPPPPVRCAVITSDKQAQGVQIMRLFWELVPKHELAPGVEFNSRTGFRGHVPVVRFKNGSEVVWYSNAAGAKTLQGSEYHYIQCDEPVYREVFDEARARVRNLDGMVGLTLTPLHLPVPWLQVMCEEGLVSDHHYPLTVENQTSPVTGLIRRTKAGTPWDEEFIANLRRLENPIDAPIKLDGEFEARTVGQFFACFDPIKHVSEALPTTTLKLALGIDYASADRELGMCAVLSGIESQVEEDGRKHDYVYALDEVVVPGSTTMEAFARRILRMLADHKIRWSELDHVYGDNPVRSRFVLSSNRELQRWVARHERVDQNHLRPRILSAKEGGGRSGRTRRSKDLRCRWMYGQIAADRVRIHPRCQILQKALQEWNYGDRHPYKDILDAWMYGLKDYWAEADRWGTAPTVRVW